MGKEKKLSLQKEVEREAAKIEREIENNEQLKGMEVSQAMESTLFSKIREYKKKNKDLIYVEKKTGKVDRMPHYKRLIASVAVVILLVAGIGVTAVGDKSYLKEFWNTVVGNEKVSMTNVKDMDTKKTKDKEEIDIYKEVGEKLGIISIRLGYKPKGMRLQKYQIDMDQKQAKLFYVYNNRTIRFFIYLNGSDSSMGEKEDVKLTDEFTVDTQKQSIHVEEYIVDEDAQSRFVADFEYQGIKYQLKGIIDKGEFIKIINKFTYF